MFRDDERPLHASFLRYFCPAQYRGDQLRIGPRSANTRGGLLKPLRLPFAMEQPFACAGLASSGGEYFFCATASIKSSSARARRLDEGKWSIPAANHEPAFGREYRFAEGDAHSICIPIRRRLRAHSGWSSRSGRRSLSISTKYFVGALHAHRRYR